MAMFDVQFDVFVDARPPDTVTKLLSHLDNSWVAFVLKLKHMLA